MCLAGAGLGLVRSCPVRVGVLVALGVLVAVRVLEWVRVCSDRVRAGWG